MLQDMTNDSINIDNEDIEMRLFDYSNKWKEFTSKLRKDRMRLVSDIEDDNADDQCNVVIKSPEEILDETVKTLNDQLANSLITTILNINGRQGDTFFERLVTDLIAKMGYGEGYVTPASYDSGIDGIITTDKLGFDPIMIQAKRYSPENQVSRPDVQGHFISRG